MQPIYIYIYIYIQIGIYVCKKCIMITRYIMYATNSNDIEYLQLKLLKPFDSLDLLSKKNFPS